jgi:hypothetical protein
MAATKNQIRNSNPIAGRSWIASLAFASAFAANLATASADVPLTTSETWVTKSLNHLGLLELGGHRTLAEWCAGRGNSVEFGSFQAAQAIDALGSGLYFCKGEFVNTPQKPQVILFKIESCALQLPEDLKKTCP